jgi:pimeloyl-ACP methyl ester carboxylesterase
VPTFPLSQGYSAVLSIRNASGDPKIKLYYANQTNGDTGYLHDVNAAARQFDQEFLGQQLMLDYARSVGEVSTITSYSLPIGVSSGELVKSNFLFEGSGSGSGELVLTVSKGNLILAESSRWIEIADISKLIEFATVTNVTQSWPEMVYQQKTSGFKLVGSPRAQPDSKEIAVFVHGWRMPDFSETMFKRLYWEGFQGRFATLRWPTRSAETDPFLGLNYATFNRSEHIAFDSGAGTAGYLNSLRNRYPDYKISVCCHSMGAVVMMEALRQLAQANSQPINNLVLMQGAIAAQAFDANVTNYPLFVEREQSIPTPNLYSNYGTNISAALRSDGKIVNFFNPVDLALRLWQVNQGFQTSYSNETVTIKPNTFFGYYTDGVTNTLRPNIFNQSFESAVYGGYYGDGPTRPVTNAYEVMPFISRPRSLAVGAMAGVFGEIQGGEVNLTQFGFGSEAEDHSGEFNRNLQEPQVVQFYPELKRQLFPEL